MLLIGNYEFPFKCASCETTFAAINALLQHVKSNICNAKSLPRSLLGKFFRFLRSRISTFKG